VLLALLLAAALVLPPDVEVLVLRSGATIRVSGPVQVKENKVLFRDSGGAFYSLDVAEIDADATAKGPSKNEPAAKPAASTSPRKLAVSPEEKARLLEELSHSRGQPAPLRSESRPSPSPSPSPSPAPTALEKESEQFWRDRARAARAEIERAKGMLAALQRREDDLESTLLMLRGHYRDSVLTAQLLELERVRYAIEAETQNLIKAEKAWFDLQEDARKKDILPGWLR
jgi:hypothetical protein